MSLLIYALVVLLIAGVAIMVLRQVSPDANVTNIGTAILLLIALLVIVNRAGVL